MSDITQNLSAYEQRANEVSSKIQAMKEKKAASTATLQAYEQREAEIRSKISNLGLTPEGLKPKMEENQKLLDGILTNLENIMPGANGVIPQVPQSAVVPGPMSVDDIPHPEE